MVLTSAITPITLCGFSIYHHGNVISQHTCGNNISHIGNNISQIDQSKVAITSATIVMFQLQIVVTTTATMAMASAILHTGPSGITSATNLQI